MSLGLVLTHLGKYSAHLASLHLLDVIQERVGEEAQEEGGDDEPPFSLVVKAVWLVPVWKLSDFLVS